MNSPYIFSPSLRPWIRTGCYMFCLSFLCQATFVFMPVSLNADELPGTGYLTPQLTKAIEDMRWDRATPGQQALLFQNNDLINQARSNGWIPDSAYQKVQNNFSNMNQEFARAAAAKAGADFTPQVSTSNRFSPGTDSDYIVTVKSKNPVGQIKEMQGYYNEMVNSHLRKTLQAEGMVHKPKLNWHNTLDVDFMANPDFVTDEQFRQIAKLNNDAYVRRNAASYERISRTPGEQVTPEQFRDYADEMKDFIKKKQTKLTEFRKNPSLLKDPKNLYEYHRLMAQEQKYISRIESAKATLRRQEKLPVKTKQGGVPEYEMIVDEKGNSIIRKRSQGKIASRGSSREYANRRVSAAASGLAENSTRRAIRELSESMAQAAKKNPQRWPNMADDIAKLTDDLPIAQKAALIERLRNTGGAVMAHKVAHAMRARVIAAKPTKLERLKTSIDRNITAAKNKLAQAGQKADKALGISQKANYAKNLSRSLDNALKSSLRVSDDLSKMNSVRRTVNQQAGKALGKLGSLGKLGNTVTVLQAAGHGKTYVTSLMKSIDFSLSPEERAKHAAAAAKAKMELAQSGGMFALFEAVPTLGAMYGGWTMGYEGTRWVLTHTETGQKFDRWVFERMDRHMKATEHAKEQLTEFFGGTSERMKRESQYARLEKSYIDAIRDGRIKLKPGIRMLDVSALIRAGEFVEARKLIAPGPNASQALKDKYSGKAKKPAVKHDPNDDLIWISQTKDIDEDKSIREAMKNLKRQGKSPFGDPAFVYDPVTGKKISLSANSNSSSKPSRSANIDYRHRAEKFISAKQSRPKVSNYRRQAEELNGKIVQREEQIRRQQEAERRWQAEQYQRQLAQQAWQEQQIRQAEAEQWYRQQQLAQDRRARWQRAFQEAARQISAASQQFNQPYSTPNSSWMNPSANSGSYGNWINPPNIRQNYGPRTINTPRYGGSSEAPGIYWGKQ